MATVNALLAKVYTRSRHRPLAEAFTPCHGLDIPLRDQDGHLVRLARTGLLKVWLSLPVWCFRPRERLG